ncbi:MAG: DUF4954 domain-containing protein, partial [Flavitalea sp.]
ASFTILAKGDFPAELNIPIPFSLVSNDVTNDRLLVMPGYWFMYNMYALARNAWKYNDRDKRTEKKQLIEHDFLAPDTINEIISSLTLFEKLTGEAYIRKNEGDISKASIIGKRLLIKNDPSLNDLEITSVEFENTNRTAKLLKVPSCYLLFKGLVNYYAATILVSFMLDNKIKSIKDLEKKISLKLVLSEWKNIGGQLLRTTEIDKLRKHIQSGKLKNWEDVHEVYAINAENYAKEKLQHAIAAVKKVNGIKIDSSNADGIRNLLKQSIATKKWLVDNIYSSREKDYTNPFRIMAFENEQEMNKVVGNLADNPFILQEREGLEKYKKNVTKILKIL